MFKIYCKLTPVADRFCSSTISHVPSFYDCEVKVKCPTDTGEMIAVHVGKAKDCLDLVDPALTISDVTSVFGNFVKFTVDDPGGWFTASSNCE